MCAIAELRARVPARVLESSARMKRLALLALTTAACGKVTMLADGGDPQPDAARAPDGATGPDAGTQCDPLAPWSAPVPLYGLSTPTLTEGTARLSPDELTIYFETGVVPADGNYDLYVAHRARRDDAFGAPALLSTIDSSAGDLDPTVSRDGLLLVFASTRIANEAPHLYVAIRTSTLAAFGAPALADGVESPDPRQNDLQPYLTADGAELWFASTRAANEDGYELYRAARTATGFDTPALVSELSSSADECLPTLADDRLTIYFASTRPDPASRGGMDVFVAHRAHTGDPFGTPVLVPELSSASSDFPTWLSPDGCRLYMISDRAGSFDIYMASRAP